MAFDVAINSRLYESMQNEVMTLTIIEAVANKHGIKFSEDGNKLDKSTLHSVTLD